MQIIVHFHTIYNDNTGISRNVKSSKLSNYLKRTQQNVIIIVVNCALYHVLDYTAYMNLV